MIIVSGYAVVEPFELFSDDHSFVLLHLIQPPYGPHDDARALLTCPLNILKPNRVDVLALSAFIQSRPSSPLPPSAATPHKNAALAWNEENPEALIDMETMVPSPQAGELQSTLTTQACVFRSVAETAFTVFQTKA